MNNEILKAKINGGSIKATTNNAEEMKGSISNKVVYTGGTEYEAGDNIKIENNIISVITTNDAEQDNTTPMTSAGVYTQLGNINVLLGTI